MSQKGSRKIFGFTAGQHACGPRTFRVVSDEFGQAIRSIVADG